LYYKGSKTADEFRVELKDVKAHLGARLDAEVPTSQKLDAGLKRIESTLDGSYHGHLPDEEAVAARNER